MRVQNHGLAPVTARLTFSFAADYADTFEVRGMLRNARGKVLPPEVSTDQVALGYTSGRPRPP